MTCLNRIIEIIEGIRYDTIPPEMIKQTKDLLSDYTGVLIAGSAKPEARALLEALGGGDAARDAEQLACYLGTTSRMLDFDDGHRFAMGHPGVALFSAALAVAFTQPNVDGKTFIEAVVRGYEIYGYQGRAINSSAYLIRGFDATAVCGAAGSAVIAATLMGLDKVQMQNAVALAASLCGGLNQAAVDGSMQKYVLAGWAAKLGIASAKMAKMGIDGPIGVFEGKFGYCNALSPTPDLEHLHNPVLRYEIGYAYTKIYSCVRRIHASLDAVEAIMETHHLGREDVAKVDVYGCDFLLLAGGYDPGNLAQAQTCIPYAVALLLQFGEVTEARVADHIGDPVISVLSRRVEVHLDDEFVKLAETDNSLWGAARVAITTTAGDRYEDRVIYPRGEPENPFPDSVKRRKFDTLAGELYEADAIECLYGFMMDLDSQGSVDRITFPILRALQ